MENKARALKKLRALVKSKLAHAKDERACLKILYSMPVSIHEKELRNAAVKRMLSVNTFSACKCACVVAKPDSALAISALSGMLANAKTTEEFEIVARLAEGPTSNFIRVEAEHRAYELRGSL